MNDLNEDLINIDFKKLDAEILSMLQNKKKIPMDKLESYLKKVIDDAIKD